MESRHGSADHDELLAQLGWMRTLARRLVRDPDVADDVLQGACLLALQRPAEVAPGGEGLRAWLAAVLRRVAGHRRRAEARREVREQRAAGPEALSATVDLAARREILRRLVETVTTLDEPGFSTIVRRYYEGRSTLEIAAQDGVAPEVVRQRLQRARVKLRERLQTRLDPRWLPALALLSPRPVEAAPPTLSRLVLRGLTMSEATTRPVVWKAAAAAIAVALGAGAWYSLAAAPDEGADAPLAALPPVRAAASAEPALPPLPPARAEPSRPAIASLASAAAPAGRAVPAPPAVSDDAAWNALWTTADATVDGRLDFGQVLGTAQTLVDLTRARLAESGATTIPDPSAPFVLLKTEGVGCATLALDASPTDAKEPWRRYTFEIALDTQAGRYTGHRQGGPERTSLRIAFQLDAEGRATSCCTVAQNQPAPSAELHAFLAGRGPQVLGGSLDVGDQAGEWKPLTWEAVTVDEDGAPLEDFSFRCRPGEAQARDASLADPRVATIATGLFELNPGAR